MGEVSSLPIRMEKIADNNGLQSASLDQVRRCAKTRLEVDTYIRPMVMMKYINDWEGQRRMDCASIIYDFKAEFVPCSDSHVLRWRLT